MFLIDLFKSHQSCTHKHVAIDQQYSYCPDCGELIENEWFITRCACCGIKQRAILKNGVIIPVDNYCRNCGGHEYTVEKLDKINRDMEIRFKILEGKPVPANLSAPAPSIPQTYDAPVANNGARVAVGDNISGDDLAPIDGTQVAPAAVPTPQNEAPAPTTNAASASAEDTYTAGMQAYNNGYYDEAEIAFNTIMQKFPQHNLAGNAQYWLGEVYVKQGNLNQAKVAFKNGYQNYHNGNKAADSLYRLGVTLENLQEQKNACIVGVCLKVQSFLFCFLGLHNSLRNSDHYFRQ